MQLPDTYSADVHTCKMGLSSHNIFQVPSLNVFSILDYYTIYICKVDDEIATCF